MKYMGSKNRIAHDLLKVMLPFKNQDQVWVEPFVGGANMIDKIKGKREGYDINQHLILSLLAIRDMPHKLPEYVCENYYKSILGTAAHPITSWVRFNCSFGSKFQGGYARSNVNRNYALESKRNAIRQSPNLQGVSLLCRSYNEIELKPNSFIYCDPPYKNTTSYSNEFNHDDFWQWAELQVSLGHTVFVSEYSAPENWDCVWSGEIKTSFDSNRTAGKVAVEKLFTLTKNKNG